MSQDQIKEIELSLEEAKKTIELGKAMDRLRANRDFRRIIEDGYFEKEAARLARCFGDPTMPTQLREAAQCGMMGIAGLMGYFSRILQQAQVAENLMREGSEVLDDLRAAEEETV